MDTSRANENPTKRKRTVREKPVYQRKRTAVACDRCHKRRIKCRPVPDEGTEVPLENIGVSSNQNCWQCFRLEIECSLSRSYDVADSPFEDSLASRILGDPSQIIPYKADVTRHSRQMKTPAASQPTASTRGSDCHSVSRRAQLGFSQATSTEETMPESRHGSREFESEACDIKNIDPRLLALSSSAAEPFGPGALDKSAGMCVQSTMRKFQ